ncbi:hypothetical protein Q9Q99_08965 [Curtobacterium flaccumfaciens]|nr:hypothetical protein Q9Q99_08965 [Curtobacterium flaccumfaciens]
MTAGGLDDDLRAHRLPDEHQVIVDQVSDGPHHHVAELLDRQPPTGRGQPAEPRQVDADRVVLGGDGALRPGEGPV